METPHNANVAGEPFQQYQSVKVETSSNLELVLMAYDGMANAIRKAIDILEVETSSDEDSSAPREIEAATEQLVKAQKIVESLFEGLNFQAGKVALVLGSFYEFIRRALVQANLSKELSEMKKALELIEQVKGFWLEASRAPKLGDEEKPVSEGGLSRRA